MQQSVVSQKEWLAARTELLAKEKEFTRLRDQLSQQRRELPWVKVEKEYIFDGPNGKESLADLFEGRSQLIVNHFMFHPEWEAGCKSCSFWADNYNGFVVHLNQRDVTMVSISRAPLERLEAFKKRMGWTFKWLSAYENDFNYDYHVSFRPAELEQEMMYNFRVMKPWGEEAPGTSVFYKNEAGDIYHTYSCYSRGLDMLNGAYQYLDIVPKGRDEEQLPYSMDWVRLHDQYTN
ncbi:DUF899 domain-containing protein [Chloroflexi bacterium TSY]|nr:DUF899 domain-containing protein [Chloroflexi bacterium TSY]